MDFSGLGIVSDFNKLVSDGLGALDDIKNGLSPAITKASPADGSLESFKNIIGNIAQRASTFETSIMGRGLRIDKFSDGSVLDQWRKNYPYRLLVYQVDKNGNYNSISEFRLPINPQELVIDTPFANKVTVTSNGILEESNGFPLKQISINGTTGIMVARPSSDVASKRTDFLGTVFAGTIGAANTFVNQANQLFSSLSPKQVNSTPNPDEDTLVQSGYFQYHMLRMFLEAYAELKKSVSGKSYRLALSIPKDNVEYLVTPVRMTSRRSVSSPLEYLYTLNFVAWGTVKDANFKDANSNIISAANDIGQTQRLFNAISQARKTLTAFQDIVTAAKADVESNIFGPMNSVILLTKDILSTPQTIADFPKSLRQSFQSSVVSNWDTLHNQLGAIGDQFNSKMQAIKDENSGDNSATPKISLKKSVLDDITLTDAISISDLPLDTNQRNSIQDVVDSAKNLNENDFNSLINNLQALSNTLEPSIIALDPTDSQWELLYSIQETISEMLAFMMGGTLKSSQNEKDNAAESAALAKSAMAYWTQSTANNNIGFTTPTGKFAIPFPFRASLESIALQYLGDATRWLEIVALNGLEAPYVDEDGFVYSFIANGDQAQFNINTKSNLFVGQKIYLSSNTQITSKRTILKIEEITPTNFLITVDGDKNLSIFKTVDKAQLKAYLPNTVNSLQQIWIPTDRAPDQVDIDSKILTFIPDSIESVKFSKIDFLLTDSGDLALTKTGFLNLAYGKTNLVQAARLKVLTQQGDLLLHPGYGAGVPVGTSNADINLSSLLTRISQSFSSDSRFNTPSSISVSQDGPTLKMDIVASVRQSNGVLPITIPLIKTP